MCFWKKELPIWAYGLECSLCQVTFINPEAHFNKVKDNKISMRNHADKIPKL